MATIRVFNDIFENKSEDFVYDTSKPLIEQIEEHIDKDYYKDSLVECYDPDTGETFYAPLEEEGEHEGVIILANGKSVDKDYIPSPTELVTVIFTPLGGGTSSPNFGAIFGGAGIGAALGVVLGLVLAPMIAIPAALTVGIFALWGGLAGAGFGYAISDYIAYKNSITGTKINKETKNSEQLPDVRGCANQSLAGNNFPYVVGKHLVTPFIIGDPYTEYTGTRGENAYIRELLCVGYGPLKLTDFKLGDFMLAYNRSHGNITKDTMIAGLLKGYSSGGTYGNGDIDDYWSKNDVEIELIQQPQDGQTAIGYGTLYPSVVKEQQINANLFFIADKFLDTTAQVTYKGVSFPNKFRTNTVIISDACPMQFTINLDFPGGLYETYNQTTTSGNTTTNETIYNNIPLWMCIQWRICNKDAEPSRADGYDYSSWNNIDFGYTQNLNLTSPIPNVMIGSPAYMDVAKHHGNELMSVIDMWTNPAAYEAVYQGFLYKDLQNFQSLGGNDGISEFRVSKTVTLTKAQCKAVLADTNPSRCIEVRVIRVSPNYINELRDSDSSEEDTNTGASSYSDLVKVSTFVTKTFDMEALRDTDTLKAVPVVSESDLKKLCFVAIKAKADSAGYIQSQMESITCIAESFSPIWDKTNKKILPEGIQKVKKYYGYFEGNTNVKTNRSNDATEREVTKAEYEEARHEGYNWYAEKCGSNFTNIMKGIVLTTPVTHNGRNAWYLPNAAIKYNNNLAYAGSLLSLFGIQAGPEGVATSDVNIPALGEWAEKSEAVTDGTKAPTAMDYNGHHYNKGDLIPVRMEANGYIYSGIKIEDLLQKLSMCGRAVWVIDEAGQVKFIMDGPVDYTKGAINAQNCISSSNTFSYEDIPAGMFITFHDENDGYENNSFYVWSDGNSIDRYHGTVEPFSVDYVTNNIQMASIARYILACRVQGKEILTRKIGPGGMIYSLGDVLLVQSDELLIGDVSGRIQEVIEESGTIYGFVMDSVYEYNAELDQSGNSNQGVTIIQPGYLGKSNAITLPISAPRTQTITETVGTETLIRTYTLQKGQTNIVLFGKVIGDTYGVPRDTSEDYSSKSDIKYNFNTGDVAMLGLIEKISAPYRITKIKPEAGGKFTETLVPYDESLYNYGTTLPSFQTYITPPKAIEPPIQTSDVPITLQALNNSYQNIYNSIGILKDDTPPANPSTIIALAKENYIAITWENTATNIKYTIIEMSKNGGAEDTWVEIARIDSDNWKYYFYRSTDGYPEATELASNYKFRLKNVSVCNVEAENWTSDIGVTTTGYGTWVPATPAVTYANADQDGISIKFTVDNTLRYGTKEFKAYVSHGGVAYPVAIQGDLTARYNFNRSTDGYPEATDFNNWKVTVNNSNEAYPVGVTSSEFTVTSNGYGTWIIPQVKVTTEVVDRTVVLTAVYVNNDNKKVYGNIQTLVKIRRYGNTDVGDSSQVYNDMFCTPTESDYFTPEFSKSITRTETADPQAFNGDTEWNYKVFENGEPETGFYFSSSNKITQTLPLIGQNPRIYKLGNIPLIKAKAPGHESDPDIPVYKWDAITTSIIPESPAEGNVYYYTGNDVEENGVIVFAQFGYYLCKGYSEVTPQGDENPQEKRWYILDDGQYVPTTDTTVVSGTTYYEVLWEMVYCKSLAVPTTYEYLIGMTNEAYPEVSGEKTGSFANAVSVTALPTNIADIVHSHEHYKNLYVEKLSAINANIGLISQGGMGSFADQLNYWALSDMTAEDSGNPGGVKKGAFRVGGRTEYFQVTPLGNDEYKIELKAGNIELTSTTGGGNGMDFLKGTFIYSEDKLQRLALTPSGFLIQKYIGNTPLNPNPNDYDTFSQITVNSNNDLIIANTKDTPEFGYQVNGNVYHFESIDPEEDESGNNPQGIQCDGVIKPVDETKSLLETKEKKWFEGSISKDIQSYEGVIGFATNSSEIQLGTKAIKIDDASFIDIPTPLTGYNTAMRQTSTPDATKTLGAYLGLNDSQIQKGIFY